MADQSDIEAALVQLVAGAIFPASPTYLSGGVGTTNLTVYPNGGTTPATPQAKVYRGWPEQATLYADLQAGVSHVSVFSESGMWRNATRWNPTTSIVAPGTPTLTATVSGNTVTIGGTVTAGNVVGVAFGPGAAYAFAYAALGTDTLQSVAAALATAINATLTLPGTATAAANGVLTLPGAVNLQAATMAPALTATEVRRQQQTFRVSVWCPTPQHRDVFASTIDRALSSLTDTQGRLTRFFQATQYEVAELLARSTYTTDMPSRDRVWRRDLCAMVDYPTTAFTTQPYVLFGSLFTQTGLGSVITASGQFAPASNIQVDVNGNYMIDGAGNLIGVRQ
jgi:hypothetical protein